MSNAENLSRDHDVPSKRRGIFPRDRELDAKTLKRLNPDTRKLAVRTLTIEKELEEGPSQETMNLTFVI